MDYLWIGLGGFLGATGRYSIYLLEKRLALGLPLATLFVNLLGCFLAGVIWGLIERKVLIDPGMKLFLLVGFLGSFTTFSTFSLETLNLLRDGQGFTALISVCLQLFLGLGLVYLGQSLKI